MRTTLRPPAPMRSDLLDGPAPRWPLPLDRILELWARCPPRGRTAARLLVAALAVIAASGGLLRGPWGPTVQVLVAARDVPAGALIGAGDVVSRSWPADLVPGDALRAAEELSPGDVAAGALPAGAIVTQQHLARGGVAGRVAAGAAVVAIPAELLAPLPVGTRLDLIVAGFDGSAVVVARAAELVADDGMWRWVRTERDEAPAVAAGINEHTLVVVVLPAGALATASGP